MKEIYITEAELEYFVNVPNMVCEEVISRKQQKSFEEEAKGCITLEEFSRRFDESIKRLIPNP